MTEFFTGDTNMGLCSIWKESDGREIVNDDLLYALRLRTSLSVTNLCEAHYKTYVTLYSYGKKNCCDPFNVHSKSVNTKLTEITVNLSREVNAISTDIGKKNVVNKLIYIYNITKLWMWFIFHSN